MFADHTVVRSVICISCPPAAVRKNRYVILPGDFDEAWKVSYAVLRTIRHRLERGVIARCQIKAHARDEARVNSAS
jgi:hypothetical protein